MNFIHIFIKIKVGNKMKINAIQTTDMKHTRKRHGQIFINNINDEIKCNNTEPFLSTFQEKKFQCALPSINFHILLNEVNSHIYFTDDTTIN